MIKIERLDHLVLTVQCIEKTCAFYTQLLGMDAETFGVGRKALKFGHQKINLHEAGNEFEPKAKRPTSGSGDLCFISNTPIEDILSHCKDMNVELEDGPVERTGATGAIMSVYLRDPDGNLIEISNLL